MKRIARFCKVSEERFILDGGTKDSYGKIKLPERATAGSAGYDFFTPVSFTLKPG